MNGTYCQGQGESRRQGQGEPRRQGQGESRRRGQGDSQQGQGESRRRGQGDSRQQGQGESRRHGQGDSRQQGQGDHGQGESRCAHVRRPYGNVPDADDCNWCLANYQYRGNSGLDDLLESPQQNRPYDTVNAVPIANEDTSMGEENPATITSSTEVELCSDPERGGQSYDGSYSTADPSNQDPMYQDIRGIGAWPRTEDGQAGWDWPAQILREDMGE